MFYLYLKTHNTTGLQYLGQTIRDPFVYKGSGTRWRRHIKKHGYDVTTTILYKTPFIEEIKEQGLYFSDLWNIVDSNEFANLCKEEGTGGSINLGKTFSEEHKRKIGESSRNRSEETKRKIGEGRRGKSHSEESKRKIAEKSKGRTNMLGKKHSKDAKRKMSGPQQKTTCPHCGKTGGNNAMTRYHFENCKLIFQ